MSKNNTLTPQEIVFHLMKGAVPERSQELKDLWKKYNPNVVKVKTGNRITLNATKDRIAFDEKTIEVFWLVGFSGWKAIETYTPAVFWSPLIGLEITKLFKDDKGLDAVERAYKERLAAVQTLINAPDPTLAPWPDDIPRPNPNREAISEPQYKAAFDLTTLAVAFTFFHEFKHVMLDRDNERPTDIREEELACDIWAREFMTVKIGNYSDSSNPKFQEVLQKRSMGFCLAALILHEITPFWDRGGNNQYFSIKTRLEAILANTHLSDESHFWVFFASLLIGIFRQKNVLIDSPVLGPRKLTEFLLNKL